MRYSTEMLASVLNNTPAVETVLSMDCRPTICTVMYDIVTSRDMYFVMGLLNMERPYITRLRCSACQSQIPTDGQCSHLIGLFTQV